MALKIKRYDKPTTGGVEVQDLEPPSPGYEYVEHSVDGNDLLVVWEHDGGQPDTTDKLDDVAEAVGALDLVCKGQAAVKGEEDDNG